MWEAEWKNRGAADTTEGLEVVAMISSRRGLSRAKWDWVMGNLKKRLPRAAANADSREETRREKEDSE